MSEKHRETSLGDETSVGWITRRKLLKNGGFLATLAAAFGLGKAAASAPAVSQEVESLSDSMGTFFQKHYRRMSKEEVALALERIQRDAKRKYDVDISVSNLPPIPGVIFGYALNLSRCKGYRKCVEACVAENNQSRDPQIQYIRVLELDIGNDALNQGDHYYDAETVPRRGKYYLPMQCMQCSDPPCVKNCPVKATWMEPDGITVVDYNWCIGCRYCMTGCPYWARRFNWNAPTLDKKDINPRTHYLGNRPRLKGVVEKCTFCIQRSRAGRLPACLEACPTGARVFGNLLDPMSEIRYVLENKKVFRLKEEIGTEPKFWYYTD